MSGPAGSGLAKQMAASQGQRWRLVDNFKDTQFHNSEHLLGLYSESGMLRELTDRKKVV